MVDEEYTVKTMDTLIYLYLSRQFNLPISIKYYGNVVLVNGRVIPVGGRVSSFEVSERGIFLNNMNLIVPAGCGHFLKSINDLEGFCDVCHRVICSRPGCLDRSDESGVLICRKDLKITWDGRKVSRIEAKQPLSILKSLIRGRAKEPAKELTDEERKLLR